MKFLLDNGNQNVSRHGAPDLRLDGVLAVAQELLDSQVLLDPFEEQFDLPAIFVQGCNRQWRQHKVVGQKDKSLASFRVFESYASQVFWVMLRGVKPVEQYRLIANKSRRSVDWFGINSSSVHVDFGSSDKESARLMHRVKSGEIQVASIHHVERSSFDWHEVQNIDFVHLSVADVDKRWDCAAQVQQRVQLDSALRFAKRSPVEQSQTKIDRRRVQRVDRVLQIQSDQIRIAVKLACPTNQQRGNVGPNAPVARLVGIGQRRAMNAVTHPHRIKFARIGAERHFDVAQALAPSQLRKCHDSKLLCASHTPNAGVAAVAIDDSSKARPRNELHNLRKKRFADVHEKSPRG